MPLLGVCTFLADQRRRSYRVLADRGVPPKYVWLSRQLVALLPVAFVLPVVLMVAAANASEIYLPSESGSYVRDTMGTVTCVLAQFVAAVAVGQFCSMLFRSGILAGLFAVLSGVILSGWCWLMLFWNVPWLWSILPIPVALLLATRLRTRDWLVERSTFRSWLWPMLVLLVPGVALVGGGPALSHLSVPLVDPGFSVAAYERPMTAEEQETLELYEQAWRQYMHHGYFHTFPGREPVVMTPQERLTTAQWVHTQRDAIALTLKASRGKLFDPGGKLQQPVGVFRLANLLVQSAAVLEGQGKLETALEHYLAAIRVAGQYRQWCQGHLNQGYGCYSADVIECGVYAHLPYWATRPKQTPERVLAALRKVEEAQHIASESDDGPIRVQYLIIRRILGGDLEAVVTATPNQGKYVSPFTMLLLRLPWERARRYDGWTIRPTINRKAIGEIGLWKPVC